MNKKLLAAGFVVTLASAGEGGLRPVADPDEPPLPGKALQLDWSLAGWWSGIAAQPGSRVAYGVQNGNLVELNLEDHSVKELARGVGRKLCLGANKSAPLLLTFDVWHHTLSAYSHQGNLLWTRTDEMVIDDVSPVDLNGDGVSEYVVGFNGHGGVLALDAAGNELWWNKTIGNVWNVCAAPKNDDSVSVLTTSAVGQVHGFSKEGEQVYRVPARGYATELRTSDRTYFGGSGDNGAVVGTLDAAGWKTQVSGYRAGVSALAVDPSIPWLGVTTVAGNLYVLRADDGTLEGVASFNDRDAAIVWAGEGTSAQLIAGTHDGLRVYSVAAAGNLVGGQP